MRGMMHKPKLIPWNVAAKWCAWILVSCAAVKLWADEPLSAVAVAENQQVYVGESFIFQVQVSGSDHPEPPDLSQLTDFTIEDLGGQQNNSQSVTIINGRMSKVVRRAYVFSYRFVPKRKGNLTIPALAVRADGQITRTRPLTIVAREPEANDDFKLKLEVSKTRCYVGEPIILTATWYLGQDVRSVAFDLPTLSDDRFAVADPDIEIDPQRQYYRVPLGSDEVVAEKGRGTVDGRAFATLRFQKVLIPKQAGAIQIGPGTVACEALVGYQSSRRRSSSPFDDDFFSSFFNDDFFGRSRRGVYDKFVTPSNSLTLNVRELPAQGRPADFAGLVGSYQIAATATPIDVNVGDPITLTVTLSGPDYLEHVQLPPLGKQAALGRDFKIPQDMAAGKIEGAKKVFVQTIRARREDVTEIPPIELPYFDTESGTYRVAKTDSIPITVKATRLVTASDAEGGGVIREGNAVEVWARGIAYNYDDLSVLEDQRYGPAAWLDAPLQLAALLAPPLFFLVLLIGTWFIRRRQADPLAARARRAWAEFNRSLKKEARAATTGFDATLQALRTYLGDKLKMPGGALTYRDVHEPLARAGVDEATLDRLKSLFAACEANQYAGAETDCDPGAVAREALELAKIIERRLK